MDPIREKNTNSEYTNLFLFIAHIIVLNIFILITKNIYLLLTFILLLGVNFETKVYKSLKLGGKIWLPQIEGFDPICNINLPPFIISLCLIHA